MAKKHSRGITIASSRTKRKNAPKADSFTGKNRFPKLEARIPKPTNDKLEGENRFPKVASDIPEPANDGFVGNNLFVKVDASISPPTIDGFVDENLFPTPKADLPEPVNDDFKGEDHFNELETAMLNPADGSSTGDKSCEDSKAKSVGFRKNLPYNLAQELLRSYSILVDSQKRQLLIYDSVTGFFQTMDDVAFGVWLNRNIGSDGRYAPYLNSSNVHQTFFRLLTTPDIQTNMDDMDPNQDFVNTLDCVVNVRTLEKFPHSPEYRFLNVLNGRYLGEDYEKPTAYLAWLNNLSQGKDRKRLLVAIIGYMLSNYHRAKKFFYIFGAPDSGKSGLLHLIESLVGEYVASHIALEDLSDKHCECELYGKKINTCGEREKGKELKRTKILKEITGGDRIEANPKMRSHLRFHGKTKLMFTANDPMQIAAQIDEPALWSRMIPFEILYTIPEEERIPDFEQKLLAQEADQITTFHLLNMRKFLNGDMYEFPLDTSTKRLLARLQGEISPVIKLFVEECCCFNPIAKVSTEALAERFKEYCSRYKFPGLSQKTLGKRIRDLYPQLDKGRVHHTSESSLRGIQGIQLREDV